MEMRHLRLVRTLAEEGTLTAAARKLFLSQSALSHQLREIEEELGVRLFHRSNRRMVPTAAGERIVSGADVILAETASLREDILQLISGESGTLRVSACRNAGTHWLPEVLRSFKNRYPGVEVSIDTAPAHDPISRLVSRSIDIAIVNVIHKKPGISYLKLFDDEFVVVVPQTHPWASRRQVGARDFGEAHLIGYDLPFDIVEFNKHVLAPAGVTPLSLTKVPTTDAIIELVRADMGVAVLDRWSAQPYLQSNHIASVHLNTKALSRAWYAAITNDCRKPPYIAQFIAYLTKCNT